MAHEIFVNTYPEATVFPFRRPGGGHQLGGVVDRDHRDVEPAAIHRAGQRLVHPPPAPYGPEARLDGEHIFAGYVSPLFGHFILESCTHLWYARQRPELPLLWCRLSPLAPYQTAVLELLGIRNQSLKVTQPTVVETLHVPDPGCVMRHMLNAEHARFLGQYTPRSGWRPGGPKLWLSRSALPEKLKSFANEVEIEDVLSADGWEIYHPEQHTIASQLETLAGASQIAGFIGSAFHSLLLLREVNAEVTIFSPKEPRIITYKTIATVKGLVQREVFLEFKSVRTAGSRQYTLLEPETVYDTLGVQRGGAKAKVKAPSPRGVAGALRPRRAS
ncbi:hypothetical protein DLJ53_17325 [Acuticoccus sediminis]|uniref:Glycosyltransferase 61 catalytic domain-containing protein n=1 Tax=Acuticoccus sediminis TaxID=2184697 RepID=A0A8B2NYV3_9HYPH|nr:hypothetical protein DLJ53_17325 [Acuticoccus sediminis]